MLNQHSGEGQVLRRVRHDSQNMPNHDEVKRADAIQVNFKSIQISLMESRSSREEVARRKSIKVLE